MMTSARSFGAWLRQQRRLLDLTQSELAQRVGCAVVTIRKFEADELRPSKQMAERLAQSLNVVPSQAADFTAFARSTSSFAMRAEIPPLQHNLPLQLTPFVGRTTELAELTALLADPTVRLITVLGPGGIGKTRLAIEVASVQLDRFPQGVIFVALATVETAAAIVPLIAESFNFTFYAEGTPRQQLCDYLRHKTMLLVLDNFEQLLGAPHRSEPYDRDEPNGVALLLDLIHAAPQIKLLVTSHVRLNVHGEQLYPLAGIDFPQDDQATATTISQSSAIDLFVQSARRVQPSFALTHENSAPIADICRLVQGMPLAILLAAAWVEMLTPAEILAELRQGDERTLTLDFLATDRHDIPIRQRSLRTVFDHSWRLLSAAEQMYLAQLSLFRGGFTRQAAQAVTGATLQELMKLVNKSFIHQQASGRYDLHVLIRHYGAERLAQTVDAGTGARDRHSRFYCALLGAQEARLKGAEQQAAVTQIELELDNMRNGWQWAAEQQQHEQLAQALFSLGLFYRWRSRYAEGVATYANAVQHLQAPQDQSLSGQRVLAQVLSWQSAFARIGGHLAEAHSLLQQSLAILAGITPVDQDVQQAKAFTFLQMGRLGEAQADFAAGRQAYQHALTLYQTLDDSWGQGFALAGLGELGYRSGDLIAGRRFFEESLVRCQRLGDQRNSAHTLERLSYILRDQGQLMDAETVTTQALTLYSALGDRDKLAAGHYALAWSAIYAGRFDDAFAQVERYHAIRTDLGLPTFLNLPGLINLELGKYTEARTQLETQLRQSRATQDKDELALGLDILACLAIVETRYVDAQALVTEAIALHQEIGEQTRLDHAQIFAGYVARGLGQRTVAQRYFFQALQSTGVHNGFLTLLFALPGIALLLADEGEIERAIEIYAQIADVPLVANSQMRWDLAGAHLASVAATLPPAVAATARARGKTGDLWSAAAALQIELGRCGWGV